jgi:hypothetical protein
LRQDDPREARKGRNHLEGCLSLNDGLSDGLIDRLSDGLSDVPFYSVSSSSNQFSLSPTGPMKGSSPRQNPLRPNLSDEMPRVAAPLSDLTAA